METLRARTLRYGNGIYYQSKEQIKKKQQQPEKKLERKRQANNPKNRLEIDDTSNENKEIKRVFSNEIIDEAKKNTHTHTHNSKMKCYFTEFVCFVNANTLGLFSSEY